MVCNKLQDNLEWCINPLDSKNHPLQIANIASRATTEKTQLMWNTHLRFSAAQSHQKRPVRKFLRLVGTFDTEAIYARIMSLIGLK